MGWEDRGPFARMTLPYNCAFVLFFFLFVRPQDKSRDESKPCEPLVRSLERLQEVFNVSSIDAMKSCLEITARQQGMGFHVTEATCYLTADLFYLEVVLLPCGGVEEVKVAPHGGSPVPSEPLLQLLRTKQIAEFSVKLAEIFTQYNIPGDSEIKLKLFASLQYLGKDLEQISALLQATQQPDLEKDVINNGRIGHLVAGKEGMCKGLHSFCFSSAHLELIIPDCPLTIQFYTRPNDVPETSDLHALVQTAQVTVGVSDVIHKLQMASAIQHPAQLDPQGTPVFLPLGEVQSETLSACFLLKLQPPIPMTASFVDKLRHITDVAIPDVDLQWAPLPKFLMRRSSANSHEEMHEQDASFTVFLPAGVMHRYILPRTAWEVQTQSGTVVGSVPFTHPAHVPALLELLRHQCAINALLRSCVTSQRSACDLHFEVRPESETSFSVTFHQPLSDSLAVLLVKVSDSREISCTLFGAGTEDLSLHEYLSTVMKRCMSIPVTLSALYRKFEEVTTALTTVKVEPSHWTPSSTVTSDSSEAVIAVSQNASVQENFSVSGSACFAMSVAESELHPEVNPVVNPYPRWVTSNSQLSELI
ncbi:uncharacterized protein V6R79_012333 [Siganus canaliculatus]